MSVKTIDDYVKKYGFCNWQAQEVIKQLEVAHKALIETAKFFDMRQRELGCLSDEAQAINDKVCAAIAVCEARGL
jgi:hypothetical protein